MIELLANQFGDSGRAVFVTSLLPPRKVVGIRHLVLIDTERTEHDRSPRRVMASVFYPAKPIPAAKHARLVDALVPAEDAALDWVWRKMPPWERKHAIANYKQLTLQARRDAAPATGAHPVLICYPAGQADRLSNVALCEQLAASGYIVFSMDSPHDSPVMVLPEGDLVTPPMPEFEGFIRERVADTKNLIDSLETFNAAGPFAGRLDLEHIGMFGASRGGYLANIGAVEDSRIKAALNMDGFLWGIWCEGTGLSQYPKDFQAAARAMKTPILRLISEQEASGAEARFAIESQDFGGEFVLIEMEGFQHRSFTTSPYLAEAGPEFELALVNATAHKRNADVLGRLLTGFFNRHLTSDAPSTAERRWSRRPAAYAPLAGVHGIHPSV